MLCVSVVWCHSFPFGKYMSSQYQGVLETKCCFPFLLFSVIFSRPCTYDGRTRYACLNFISSLFLSSSDSSMEMHILVLVWNIWTCMVPYNIRCDLLYYPIMLKPNIFCCNNVIWRKSGCKTSSNSKIYLKKWAQPGLTAQIWQLCHLGTLNLQIHLLYTLC